jgi:hypothetical protein
MSTPSSPSKRSWLRLTAIGGVLVLLLLVAAYFVLTSSTFIRSFVLPRVSDAVGAKVTVEQAQLRPFSSLDLRGLVVRTTGPDPLLQAKNVSLRYRLADLLAGKIIVEDLQVEAPVLVVTQDERSGTSNLDPLLKALATKETPPAQAAPPPVVDIARLRVSGGSLRWVTVAEDGSRQSAQVSSLELEAVGIKNDDLSRLQLALDLGYETQGIKPGPADGALRASLKTTAEIRLDRTLSPRGARLSQTQVVLSEGRGAFAALTGISVPIELDWTPEAIRAGVIGFRQGTTNLGEIRVSGPLDLAAREGMLQLQIPSLDPQLLTLVGGSFGLEISGRSVTSTNTLQLQNGGQLIALNGRLLTSGLTLQRGADRTPATDIEADYGLQVDWPRQQARADRFQLRAGPSGRPFLQAGLSRPLDLHWGGTNEPVQESSLDIALDGLNLAEWRPLTGEAVQAGTLNAKLQLHSEQAGQRLKLAGTLALDRARFLMGSNQTLEAGAQVRLEAQVDAFQRAWLTNTTLSLAQGDARLIQATTSGQVDWHQGRADLRLELQAALPELARLSPMPDLTVEAGTATFSGRVQQTANTNFIAAGRMQMSGLKARYADYYCPGLEVDMHHEITAAGPLYQVKRADVTIQRNGQPAGSLVITGEGNLATGIGRYSLNLTNVNQHVLDIGISPWLTQTEVAQGTASGTLNLRLDPISDSTVETQLDLRKVVLRDRQTASSLQPVDLRTDLAATWKGEAAQIKSLRLGLTPTARARNELVSQGTFDWSKTNALVGNMKVQADALDLTPYYDLMTRTAGGSNQPSATVSGESEAFDLPIGRFVTELSVGRLFLRDLAASNCQAVARIERNRLTLQPLSLVLNGTPIQGSLDLDLGVPGYRYDFKLTTGLVPLAPIASTFLPSYPTQTGDLLLNADVQGLGSTGTNLQKHLAGQVAFSFTNANLQLISPKAKALLTPVAVLLRVPELLQSPLRSAQARLKLGGGQVEIQQLDVLSDAFVAQMPGSIPLAPVLTNSPLQIPVRFSLRRSLAAKANLLPADAPTNAAYVSLPVFATLAGTLGNPRTDTDKLVLSGLLLRGVAGIPLVGNEKVGGVLQGLGNFLTGNQPRDPAASTNAAATNAAPSTTTATNPPALINPLNLLQNLLPRPAATNRPPTTGGSAP